MVKISNFFRFSVSVGNAPKWCPNGLKRSQKTFLWPADPPLAHFDRPPPCILGLPRPFGGPKWAQNGPKRGQKGPKMVKISNFFRFSVSAGNALKWHPNGVKRSQNTFLWPVDPLLASSPLTFGAPEAIWGSKMGPKGPQKGAKKGPKWSKSRIFSDFQFRLEMHQNGVQMV